MIFSEISQSSMKEAIQMIHQMATTMSSTMLSTKKNKLWNLEDKSPLKLLEHKPLIRPNWRLKKRWNLAWQLKPKLKLELRQKIELKHGNRLVRERCKKWGWRFRLKSRLEWRLRLVLLRQQDKDWKPSSKLSRLLWRSFRSQTKHSWRLKPRTRLWRRLLLNKLLRNRHWLKLPSKRDSRSLHMLELTKSKLLVSRLRPLLPSTKKHARRLSNSPKKN